MKLKEFFPFWDQLSIMQQQVLTKNAVSRTAEKHMLLHNGAEDCVGLLLIQSGQLRAFIVSEDGKEITLYRLLERDVCLFSASCIMRSVEFDISVEAERDTRYLQIPAAVYQNLMGESALVANYTNEIMAARFSDVMWILDQILNKKLDSRLAALLVEEQNLAGTSSLKRTHEELARHLGSAREVVTRMLQYFQQENMVSLSRGSIHIINQKKLLKTARESIR